MKAIFEVSLHEKRGAVSSFFVFVAPVGNAADDSNSTKMASAFNGVSNVIYVCMDCARVGLVSRGCLENSGATGRGSRR